MRVPLLQGDYQARSIIADAQRAVDLYAEANPKTSLVPFTHYPAPGLIGLSQPPIAGAGRGLYWGNNDQLYAVVGPWVYSISSTWQWTTLGQIGTLTGITSMSDNGTTAFLVDGSSAGYQVNLSSNALTPINSATNAPPSASLAVFAFYGANRTDMLDGFALFNQPATRNYYCTYNNEAIFDALYFAAKNGYSDDLVSLIVANRQIWLIGQRTSETWYDAGNAAFPFSIIPGPFLQHGCCATYSVAQLDGTPIWLSQDQLGSFIVIRVQGENGRPISTPALSALWATYPTVADAQAFTFQIGSHPFYQINFPTANASWRWDASTDLWHQAVWTDTNGAENRHRCAVAAFAYGANVGLDWETGQLYQISPDAYTDAGAPMMFRRGFPHIMADGKRVIYPGFELDIQCGASSGTLPTNPPLVNLRWSDDRGATWSNPVPQSLGAAGQYLTMPKWWRLGMARDRVWEVFGTIPGPIAINGAFLSPEPIALRT